MQSDQSVNTAVGVGAIAVAPMNHGAGSLLLPVLALTTEFEFDQPQLPESSLAMASPESPLFALPEKTAKEISSRVDGDVQRRQGFRLGDVGVMIGYLDGSELTEIPELYFLPNAPASFLGMANLHGNMVPVFDLVAYLGLRRSGSKQDSDRRMLLVLAHGADAAGIVIEDLPQRLSWTSSQQTDVDTAPSMLLPHVRAAALIEGQLWFDLYCDSLLGALENAMKQN